MKTIGEFMDKMTSYFGGVKNKAVADLIIEELRYIKPSDLDMLFRQLAISQPASWNPDLKSITDAIKACKIDTLSEPGRENKCPVCGHVWNTTGICPVCCYNPERDGTPDEHRQWFKDWKAGKEKRFDVHGMLNNLLAEKTVRSGE